MGENQFKFFSAMASEIETAKLLLPYLQRADELQKHEPLVAYYCKLLHFHFSPFLFTE